MNNATVLILCERVIVFWDKISDDTCACSATQLSDCCDPMDCSPSDSSARGILQARILEWVDISFSKAASNNLSENKNGGGAGADTVHQEVEENCFIKWEWKKKILSWGLYDFKYLQD